MPAESALTPTRPPLPDTLVTDEVLPPVTREEAEEARRHAAEIGDYVTAQRWLWHERTLSASADTADHS